MQPPPERWAMMCAWTCKHGQRLLLNLQGMLWMECDVCLIVLPIGHM